MRMRYRLNLRKLANREVSHRYDRRIGTKERGRLRAVDWVVLILLFLLIKVQPIPDTVPYSEWISLLAAFVILCVLLFVKFRRQAPRTCWRNATLATVTWASIMTVVPLLLYMFDELPLQLTMQVVVASSLLWIASLGCYLRLRFIRRRSRQEIARMRLRAKRQKRELYR